MLWSAANESHGDGFVRARADHAGWWRRVTSAWCLAFGSAFWYLGAGDWADRSRVWHQRAGTRGEHQGWVRRPGRYRDGQRGRQQHLQRAIRSWCRGADRATYRVAPTDKARSAVADRCFGAATGAGPRRQHQQIRRPTALCLHRGLRRVHGAPDPQSECGGAGRARPKIR